MGCLMGVIGYGTAQLWVLVSAAFLVVSTAVVLILIKCRKKQLLRGPALKMQQNALDSDSSLEEVQQILTDAGYAYDWEQGIYYSVMNPWQRELGYCSLYDDWATAVGLVYDSEPVRFNYKGKKWLIEFWKGQYGITTGGEIGIYNTTGPDLDIPGIFKGTYYHSANDDETLNMAFTLRRNNTELFSRIDRHWWLTGFVLGEYSVPSSLTMDATVTLCDEQMRDAFVEALHKLGYQEDEIGLSGNTVQFTFANPRSKQPSMRRGLVNFITMQSLKLYVAEYKDITKGLTGMPDILMALKARAPALFDLAFNIDRQRALFKSHGDIRKYLI